MRDVGNILFPFRRFDVNADEFPTAVVHNVFQIEVSTSRFGRVITFYDESVEIGDLFDGWIRRKHGVERLNGTFEVEILFIIGKTLERFSKFLGRCAVTPNRRSFF